MKTLSSDSLNCDICGKIVASVGTTCLFVCLFEMVYSPCVLEWGPTLIDGATANLLWPYHETGLDSRP